MQKPRSVSQRTQRKNKFFQIFRKPTDSKNHSKNLCDLPETLGTLCVKTISRKARRVFRGERKEKNTSSQIFRKPTDFQNYQKTFATFPRHLAPSALKQSLAKSAEFFAENTKKKIHPPKSSENQPIFKTTKKPLPPSRDTWRNLR
ncbi:hypothetical protein SAMN05444412_1078 [Rhodonellum ikkaensis]|uniref:Uncharacterized protein n=1 Tax=Rhodonellum ikkaensis TaxID=336829 RepID=A0A1H3QUF8_9BACT|nr:hypothetical protein SAMN05444412_1078 [Rhodonellum ikkaensis]